MFKTLITSTAIALSLATFSHRQKPRWPSTWPKTTRVFTWPLHLLHENGMPAHGNAFVSQGYIYPEGTLADGIVGVLQDGSPAFPDLVLGTCTCDGYFVGRRRQRELPVSGSSAARLLRSTMAQPL